MSDSLNWWSKISGQSLAQGDLISGCHLPTFEQQPELVETDQDIIQADLIVITQTCDLLNDKARFVALCMVHTMKEFETANPKFGSRGAWENVRKGRIEGLHLLASPEHPADNRRCLVIDFGYVVSLPVAYTTSHADSLNDRWRLNSPFLEHFSQSFGRFFMRVGLPSTIPPFN